MNGLTKAGLTVGRKTQLLRHLGMIWWGNNSFQSYSGPEVFRSCCQKCLNVSARPSSRTSCRGQCIRATLKCNKCVFIDFRPGKITSCWVSRHLWTAMNERNSNHISLWYLIRLMNFSRFMKMWLLWIDSFALSLQSRTNRCFFQAKRLRYLPPRGVGISLQQLDKVSGLETEGWLPWRCGRAMVVPHCNHLGTWSHKRGKPSNNRSWFSLHTTGIFISPVVH